MAHQEFPTPPRHVALLQYLRACPDECAREEEIPGFLKNGALLSSLEIAGYIQRKFSESRSGLDAIGDGSAASVLSACAWKLTELGRLRLREETEDLD